MKKNIICFSALLITFCSCNQESISYNTSVTRPITIYSEPSTPVQSDFFFWGEWLSIIDGQTLIINEESFSFGGKSSDFTEADENTLITDSNQIIVRQSENVILFCNTPFFRQKAKTIKYTIHILGYENSRRQSLINQKNKIVKSISKTHPSFIYTAESNEDGIAELHALTDDTQTVTVYDDDGTPLSTVEIHAEHDGSDLGTIVVADDMPRLKCSGTIEEKTRIYTDGKPNGYLYSNQEYPLQLKVENISNLTAGTFLIKIEPEHSSVSVQSNENIDFKSGTCFGSLPAGENIKFDMTIKSDYIDSGHLDTGITIKIIHSNGVFYEDRIPLRFNRGVQCITINTKITDNIKGPILLNGVLTCPDGKNQFFSVNENSYRKINIPEFSSDCPYKLMICASNQSSELGNAEMSYTVTKGDIPLTIETITEQNFLELVNFAEDNNSEEKSYFVTNYFQGYLGLNDFDFYEICFNDDIIE